MIEMPDQHLYLPGVEQHPQPGARAEGIRTRQAAGQEYPMIWHLFAYRPQATDHLARFTQEVMRGEGPLSPGLRELIAAFTSAANHCPF
jgi:alkylhydroperoxidase family enzyme